MFADSSRGADKPSLAKPKTLKPSYSRIISDRQFHHEMNKIKRLHSDVAIPKKPATAFSLFSKDR